MYSESCIKQKLLMYVCVSFKIIIIFKVISLIVCLYMYVHISFIYVVYRNEVRLFKYTCNPVSPMPPPLVMKVGVAEITTFIKIKMDGRCCISPPFQEIAPPVLKTIVHFDCTNCGKSCPFYTLKNGHVENT